LKSYYRYRQQVEETFRLLKQEFGWCKCRARSVRAQSTHLHLRLYALCLVQVKAQDETVYRYQTKLISRSDIDSKPLYWGFYSLCVILEIF
jgi:hypothetical protein